MVDFRLFGQISFFYDCFFLLFSLWNLWWWKLLLVLDDGCSAQSCRRSKEKEKNNQTNQTLSKLQVNAQCVWFWTGYLSFVRGATIDRWVDNFFFTCAVSLIFIATLLFFCCVFVIFTLFNCLQVLIQFPVSVFAFVSYRFFFFFKPVVRAAAFFLLQWLI